MHCVHQGGRNIGRDGRTGWGVTYTARARIRVGDGAGAQVIQEGSGAGHGIDIDLGQAHESALKEAETDAMKRALMTFGNPFGLALYDKQQREVTSSAAPTPVPTANPSSRPAEVVSGRQPQSPTQREIDPSLDPLDPGTIHQLHSTIRSLPRPALEGLTKAFRKRFQVPPDALSIADRICQRRHHEWIETFLVSHR